MQKRTFGNSGFAVSLLGLGASHVGDADVTDSQAERFLNEALDLGITLVDTARGYGLSEERIGRFITHRRSEFVLSTKGGYHVEDTADWSPECITLGVERALRVMRTDCIDIFHLHSCDLWTLQHNGVAEALVKMREAGKIRAAAYSGENDPRAWAIRSGMFDSIQSSLNLCDQMILQRDMPEIQRRGLGFIAKRPIANAFWRFHERPVGDYAEDYWVRAKQMNLASPIAMEWDEFALRFTLHQPGVCAAIVGTKSIDRLRRNVETAQLGPLPAELNNLIQEAFRDVGANWEGLV